ncbi:hypothetical protein HPB52_007370 [Rhipicephalus sanguineus]|uniref:Uncharacterized protein n=1 Tax=Rhipicephalus sanguineus TaxID=34632 RepID=A0A9D4SS94_RHISA|nr:hypothetical protein HPB52_007370 [Rhipicephalus sanguineus]
MNTQSVFGKEFEKRRAHAKGLDLAVVAALRVLYERSQAGYRRFLCVRWAPGTGDVSLRGPSGVDARPGFSDRCWPPQR